MRGAPRPGNEAHLCEQRHDLRLGDGLAVEALDREAADVRVARVPDERGERRA